MPRSVLRCSMFVAFGLLLFVRSAHGYIDPGTGSYMLQTLLAILFAMAYTLKIYWRHVTGFFRYRFGRKHPDGKSEK